MEIAKILKSLAEIANFCFNQNTCKECSIRNFCQKMPSEW